MDIEIDSCSYIKLDHLLCLSMRGMTKNERNDWDNNCIDLQFPRRAWYRVDDQMKVKIDTLRNKTENRNIQFWW